MTMSNKKIALVTGASRGIGKAIALKLANAGMEVIVNYNRSKESAEEVVNEVQKNNGKAHLVPCDVSNRDQVNEMFRKIQQNIGEINVLVNNAGITKDMAFYRMGYEEWLDVINTNLNGTFYCIKACALEMLKRKYGRIINISSLSSYYGAPGQANYAASKAGIVGLTRCLGTEFGPYNITVNSVIPGLIPTDMVGKVPQPKLDAMEKKIPLRKFGTTEDIASLVGFLVSDEASYITGQVITADGGLSCVIG